MAGVAGFIFLVCSCASSSGHDTGVVDSEDGRYATPGLLRRYFPSVQEDKIIATAKDALIRECLGPYGFHLQQPVISTESGLVSTLLRSPDYSSRGESDARKYGFHPATNNLAEKNTTNQVKPQDQDALILAINGSRGKSGVTYNGLKIPRYGCAGEAEKTLSKGAAIPFKSSYPGGEMGAINILLRIRSDIRSKMSGDEEMKKLNDSWDQCFGDGFGKYSSPRTLSRDSKWRSSSKVTKVEISAAVTSAKCQSEIGYVKKFQIREGIFEKEEEEANIKTLKEIRALFEVRLGNAESVTKSS